MQSDHKKDFNLEEKIQATPPTPGLVARLMGLETMPELDVVPKQRNPGSIGRSRSANSVDYSSAFDPSNPQHRRVKTSWSFREMPSVLQLENDEFLLLTFENVGENKELRSNGRKSEMDSGELKQGRVDGSKNRENKRVPSKKKMEKKDQERIKCDCNKKERQERRTSGRPCREILDSSEIKDSGLVRPHKVVTDKSKLAKKNNCRHVPKKVEPECNSENCSPVSVLDLYEFQIDHESSLSEEELKGTCSNSRRKLSPDVLNSDYPSHNFTSISIEEIPELRSIDGGEGTEAKKLDTHIPEDYKELWGEVCKLTEEEMKTSNWMPKEVQKMEEVEEIRTEFGLQIFNQILQDIVTELDGFPIKNFAL
ncbi:hypothetical protein BVC80_9093g51 [Macleaya cordata]|uniref:DUF3741 domain-containing protein n=1 Tax=Macleaya cordata TaxID=56857 RepID=A0A200PWW5_MACCD|nr:hypothetical protein BVC80_9093g51 [Macleaya cordata]